MIVYLYATVLGLVVQLPDGSVLEAQRLDVYPDAAFVVVYEAPLFANGFE